MLIQSERVQKAQTLSNRKFKRLFGVKRQFFFDMLEIVHEAYEQLHKHGGKPSTKNMHRESLRLMSQNIQLSVQKNQNPHYSGKQKCHIVKTQIVIDLVTRMILFVRQKVDSGYQGIAAFHTNSEISFKKGKNRPLTEEEKAFSCQLARERIAIEHVNREIKIFKTMSVRYCNRRRRRGMRMNLICAIRNSEIKHNKS
jgi:hypothetical protein